MSSLISKQKHFFMRTELEGIFNEETLLADLNYSLPAGTNCRLISAKRKRIVILVTKEAHCLGDIFNEKLLRCIRCRNCSSNW